MKQNRVVIVGAGPVGMLLASELGVRGVPVTVLETKSSLIAHPKANTHNARSMEIYRRHDITDRLRSTGLPLDRPTDVGYFTRLFGRELHRVPLPSSIAAQAEVRKPDTRWPTPEPQLRTTQMALEPLLLERARSFPCVDVRFGTTVEALEQDDNGVRVRATNEAGAAETFGADYAVGCDGGRSFVRKQLGIGFAGEGGLQMDFLGGPMLATYFRAPTLLSRFPHSPAWMHWMMLPSTRSILVTIDPVKHEFLLHVQLGQDDATSFDFGERLARVAGEPIPYEIISSAEWRAGIGLVADHYRSGRVFLAGDAVHLFTPTGGFGLNTGIEDAFNLGWKLARACKGDADAALLDSYELERRPIGLRNTAYALSLAAKSGACPVSESLEDPGEEGEAARAATATHLARFVRWEFDTPGIQLGGRYDRSPLIIADEGPLPPDLPEEYVPSGAPGGRLPHIWCRDGSSLFDHLGQEFTMIGLTGEDGAADWEAAAREVGADLIVLSLPDEPKLRALIGADWVLVRPDQYIAWRGSIEEADLTSILATAAGVTNRTAAET